ncbi:ovomucoid-like isoform X6 [Erpetoichthys calabaricus]|uniref:ovomucoid-like isoform X6 n=1 Tax=Erpetoichthys calabaricus TaxID=27687 RepID=UPI0010A0AFEA|nr:ovomucoid-like isoform X6 [Erpetoichthys calabaricus]
MLGSQSDTHTHTPVRQVEMSAMRILLLCVAFICLSVLRSEADMVQPDCEKLKSVRCSLNSPPVCASNGQTYSSPCGFCIVKRSSNSQMYAVKNGLC